MSDTITPYLEIRDKLDTFTTINCVPNGCFWSKIGHTAVLYKDPSTGQLMILESTTLNKFTGLSGVQMMPFGLWLAHYPGKVFVRIPVFKGWKDGSYSKTRRGLAEEFIKTHLGTSYPDIKTFSGRLKLYMAKLDFEIFGVDYFAYTGDDDGIFCTMLLIMFLQHCGLFEVDMRPDEYEPDDTRGDDEAFEDELINCTYGKEIQLK